jgi:hypothetical protein
MMLAATTSTAAVATFVIRAALPKNQVPTKNSAGGSHEPAEDR